jgi:hypothetical protein
MRAIDIAWAAGLFEGEGSIGCRMVAITQKDTWCLFTLKAKFNGTVGNERADGTSQWWLCGQAARNFVKAIYPYLSPRRKNQIDSTFIDDKKLEVRKRIHRENCRARTGKRIRDNLGRLI